MATSINDVFAVWDEDSWDEDTWGVDEGAPDPEEDENELLASLYYTVRRLLR